MGTVHHVIIPIYTSIQIPLINVQELSKYKNVVYGLISRTAATVTLTFENVIVIDIRTE